MLTRYQAIWIAIYSVVWEWIGLKYKKIKAQNENVQNKCT